ncbi:MAG: AAA family ATPase [Methylocella sp.]|jgi:aminoglycoside phosphotransferase family enzyme/gluconate kinase
MKCVGQDQAADQSEVFAFLSDPATHRLKEPVTRIDTHGAAVFLAGANVYKVKRAVHFSFMDFSTLEKRRRACENELAVNRANAPDLYLGVVPISRKDNALIFGAGEEIIEWAVHLRRFDEERTLDRLAARGQLDSGTVTKLAEVVVTSHRQAPILLDRGATAALAARIEETMTAIEAAPNVFPAAAAASLKSAMLRAFGAARPLLLRREADGWVRHCHGDLHLRNIVLIGATPTLFDALEFDDSFAICDVLYDLAFLLMDLWTRGLRSEANGLMNRYLSASEAVEAQLEGLAALPLFLSLRAAVRANVTNLEASRTAATIAAARRLFDAACAFFEPSQLHLIVIGGLSGTGKTSLARAVAPAIGRAPGAIHLRSDVERKRLYHLSELQRLPEEAYRPDISAATYQRLRDLAARALAAGQSVVVDAAHLKPKERTGADVAARAGARFKGLWLEAPMEVRLARVSQRRNDASDAGPTIAAAQADEPVGQIAWLRLDASQSTLVDRALAAIKEEA